MNANELAGIVGEFVRLRPCERRKGWHTGRLLRIDGNRCVIKPSGHKVEEFADPDEIVPWMARSARAEDAPKLPSTMWVLADASRPVYYDEHGNGWTGNPAEATVYGSSQDAAEVPIPKGMVLFPMPLLIAIERYEAIPRESEIREVLVEVPIPTEPPKQSGGIQDMVDRHAKAKAVRDTAKQVLDQAELDLAEAAKELRSIYDQLGRAVGSVQPVGTGSRSVKGELLTILRQRLSPGRTYDVKEMVDVAVRWGWFSSALDRRQRIMYVVGTNPEHFDRVGHGKYVLKATSRLEPAP